MPEIYFDNCATTPVYPEVRDVVVRMMEKDYGNPSSMHRKGYEAEQLLKRARKEIADTLKVQPKEIFFTSGGTEANNLALIGTALAHRKTGRRIIAGGIEHASVYNTLGFLEDEGFEIVYLPVDSRGIVRLDALSSALTPDTFLVTVMCVNNEIGAVEPVEEIGKLVKNYDPSILFHTDCIQAYGKLPCLPRKWKADLLSVSGHKIHGPKGTGFLYIKSGTKIKPILWGGNQQEGMRSGTENTPGIVGLARAAQIAHENLPERAARIAEVKNYFIEQALAHCENVRDNSGDAPHIASLSFPGVRSEVLLHALEERGICVSAGSACSSNKPGVSGTLKGIGLTKEYYESTLRFSFSVYNTKEEADACVQALCELLPVLRRFRRR